MKRHYPQLLCLALLSAGILTGCAASKSAGVYSQGEMRQAQTVQMGTVVSVQPVKMEGKPNPIISLGGAVLGGLAGSKIGGGRGQVAGGVVGAIAGGVGAEAAQRGISKDALEITVKLDGSKRLVSIVQEADIPFTANQRVRVLTGGGNDRVMPQ